MYLCFALCSLGTLQSYKSRVGFYRQVLYVGVNRFVLTQLMDIIMKPMKRALKQGPDSKYPGYTVFNHLGSGSYGSVVSAKQTKSGKMVAIKQLTGLFQNKFYALRALREVTLLRVIDHPNIIKIYEIIPPADQQNFNSLALVLEYLPLDLGKLHKQNISLTDTNIEKIVYQILLALKYLKDAKILHRDLKPDNLLVDGKTFQVKVCDFGLARSITVMEEPKSIKKEVLQKLNEEIEHQKQEEIEQLQKVKKEEAKTNQLTFHVVTRFYRAPEIILLNPHYDSSIDMWSIGCILAELINSHKKNKVSGIGYKPFFHGKACFPLSPPKMQLMKTYSNQNGFPHSQNDQIMVILKVIGTPSEQDVAFLTDKYALSYIKSFPPRPRKNMEQLFNYSTPEWCDFLDKTLVFNPKKRMSIQKALVHPMFQKVRDQKLQNMVPKKILENLDLHSGLTIQEIRQKFVEEIRYHANKQQP